MARIHSERWFQKQEARLAGDPFQNTRKYYIHGLKLLFWFLIFPTVNAIRCLNYLGKSREQSQDYLGSARAVTLTGAPGVGKTFSASNFAVSLALQRWEQLQSDYILQSGLINRWISEGDIDKIAAFRSLEESYFFYKEREEVGIPCLISSVPLKDRSGRFSYTLTPEVPLQLLRIPEYTVIFNDESGLTQGANTSRNASSDIRDFYRFNRHFGDYMFLNTEQGGDQNAKYMRIVTDYNIRLTRQEWVMSPKAALWRHEKAKARFFKRQAKGKYSLEREKYLIEKLYFREKYLKTIGFRAIPYRFEQSEGNTMDAQRGVYIFSASGLAEYDSRSYRNLYKCKDQALQVRMWRSLLVCGVDPHEYDDQIAAS